MEYLIAAKSGETGRQVTLELFFKQRDTFRAAAAMADRILNHHVFGTGAVLEKYLNTVSDGTFLRIIVIGAELGDLYNFHFIAHSRGANLTAEQYEIQMLYGVKPQLQDRLLAAGHTLRVYVPFGHDWYGYFSRRLAERPANAAFVVRGLFG